MSRIKKSKPGVTDSHFYSFPRLSDGSSPQGLRILPPEQAAWWRARRKMICVDLDETLAANSGKFLKGTGKVGEPIERVAHMVRLLRHKGYYIVLYTGRDWNELDAIQDWCIDKNIPIDEYWLSSKPPALVFIDDRAVNPTVPGWEKKLAQIIAGGRDPMVEKAKELTRV